MVYPAFWCGPRTAGPCCRGQKAVMVVPSWMVKAGCTLAPVWLVTITVTCCTVASWPVVCTDWIDMVRGLGAVMAMPTAAVLAAAPQAATHVHRRHGGPGRECRVVAAAAMVAGISIAR